MSGTMQFRDIGRESELSFIIGARDKYECRLRCLRYIPFLLGSDEFPVVSPCSQITYAPSAVSCAIDPLLDRTTASLDLALGLSLSHCVGRW